MFSLQVHTENLDFQVYMRQESTYDEKSDAFLFSHAEQATNVLARYLLYVLKEDHFYAVCSETGLPHQDKEEFFLYVSSDKLKKIHRFIYQKLLIFLSEHSSFDLEGFIAFRLPIEKELLGKVLWIAYYEFIECRTESTDIEQLKKMLDEQPTSDEPIAVVVEEDGTFTVRSERCVYLQGETEEDTLLSHLILLSPPNVDVFETGGTISPTYSQLLTQLFEKKVMFHGHGGRPSVD